MIRELKAVNSAIPSRIKRLITLSSEDAVKNVTNDKDVYIEQLKERIFSLNTELKALQFDILSIPDPSLDLKGAKKAGKGIYDKLHSLSDNEAKTLIAKNFNMYNMSQLRSDFPAYADAVEEAIDMYKRDIERQKKPLQNASPTPNPSPSNQLKVKDKSRDQ